MKYFAYGSNMNPARMKKRKVNFSVREHAVLNGYSLQFNKIATGKLAKRGEGKGNIVCDTEGIVEGALYEIEPLDRNKLDCAEGYPSHYDRITVLVQSDNGTVVEAFTYIAKPNMVKDGLKPTRDYLNNYLAARDILSEAYYQKLASWPTLDVHSTVMPNFGPEPGALINSYVDAIPSSIKRFGRDSERKTLLKKYETRLEQIIERYSRLTDLLIWAQDGNYLDLLLETRSVFIHGYFWATVALCGMTIESVCKDIARLRSDNPSFIQHIREQDVRKNIEELKDNGYFCLHVTPKLMHNALDIRNDYAHVKKEKLNPDEVFDCLLKTNLVIIAEFGLMPSSNGVVRVDRTYFDIKAKAVGIDIDKFW